MFTVTLTELIVDYLFEVICVHGSCVIITGTIVAMEKIPGVLTKDHILVIEAERDRIEEDLRQCVNY